MRQAIALALLAATTASSACSRSDARTTLEPQSDTLHSAEESLRRFRETLTPVESLAPTFEGKEHVARTFVAAIAANDVKAVALTLMTRAEFAWLYYPENPISEPPYELPVGIAWFELEGNSLAGVRRALATYGGRSVVFRDVECPGTPVVQGPHRLWNGCMVLLGHGDASDSVVRMFGSIIERDGRFKLVTAANDL
jgi:hypothetical protein